MYDSEQGLTSRAGANPACNDLLLSRASSDKLTGMLWTFERGGEHLHCEIRREGAGTGYELIITNPDGSQRMERFDEAGGLIARALDFQRELIEGGWRSPKGGDP